jgi:hypothetical protein
MDPSEATAPHQIEDALNAHFEVLATFDRGELYWCPSLAADAFPPRWLDQSRAFRSFRDFTDTERALIRDGVIKSLNRPYVARPRR